jgi:hypothetical protein
MGRVDGIHQSQVRDWWHALVNMIMNLQVPLNARNISRRI